MSRLPFDARTNVYWATSISNKNAPTVAEITAAVNVTAFVTADGLQPSLSTNTFDSFSIADKFDAKGVGTYGADFKLSGFRDDVSDTLWNLMVYGTVGFLIIDRFRVSGTLPSVGHKVEVWPAQMHVPVMENSSRNTQQRFVESFAITAEPAMSATVA